MSKLLLFVLSTYKNEVQKETYSSDKNEYFDCTQTNEAPVKCLLKENSKKFDSWIILPIVTKEVLEIIENKNENQFNFFKGIIEEYQKKELADKQLTIKFDYIKYISEKNAPNEYKESHIYNQLSDFLAKNSDIKEVYIDYTGGFRDLNYHMTSIIQFMETQNIKCRKIIYSKFKPEYKIYDLRNIYKIEKLISGIKEYLNTSNIVSLREFFINQNDFPIEIQKVTQDIEFYANAMSVCNIEALEESRKELIKSLSEMEKQTTTSNLYGEMFKALTPTIKEKMLLNEENINYPQMIEWCINNRQLQQAVTLYVEKMPYIHYQKEEYLKQTCPINEEDKSKTETNTYELDRFYQNFFDTLSEWLQESYSNNKISLESNIENILKSEFGCQASDTNKAINILEQYSGNYQDSPESWLRAISNSFIRVGMKPAYDNLKRFIENHYNISSGERKKDIDLQNNIISNIPRNFCNFKKQLLKEIKYQKYFFENKQVYENKKVSKSIKQAKSYLKKYLALEAVKFINDANYLRNEAEQEHLARILYAYLSIKIIRNRMNHAVESSDRKYETMTIDLLKQYRFKGKYFIKDLDLSLNFESIKKILEFGLSLYK